jgi:hypothetical protein
LHENLFVNQYVYQVKNPHLGACLILTHPIFMKQEKDGSHYLIGFIPSLFSV